MYDSDLTNGKKKHEEGYEKRKCNKTSKDNRYNQYLGTKKGYFKDSKFIKKISFENCNQISQKLGCLIT